MSFFSALRRRSRPRPGPPEPRLGGPAETWLRRSVRTVEALGRLPGTLPAGPVAERLAAIHRESADVLTHMRALAARVTALEHAVAAIPGPDLTVRRERLLHPTGPGATSGRDGAVPESVRRELQEITAQLDAESRLRATRADLLDRMEAAARRLEGLLTRAAEVSALAQQPTGTPVDVLDGVTDDLEGLRAGLLETGRISRGELPPPPT